MSGTNPGDPARPARPAAGLSVELSADAILPVEVPCPYPFLAPPRAPGELGWAEHYRVIRLIGAGGMGMVFEAEDTALRRPVALKVLRPELAAERDNRERFVREAQAAAGLASDHVVTIYHVGTVGGVPYMATQLMPGESLQDRIERANRLTLPTALTVARHAAAGLAAAHAVGLVHRDVKPANVWLETDGPDGPFRRVRILDFGLARRVGGEASLTATGFIVGTPNFMSPEQAHGFEVDHRADLFSLGAVLYTMLTGELPFPGPSAMAVLVAVTSRPAVPVIEKNPAVPPAVSDLVTRMLAKNPADRPQSAAAVIEVLDAALAALPTWEATPLPAAPPDPSGLSETPGPSASVTAAPRPPVPRPAAAASHWKWKWAERLTGGGLTLALLVWVVFQSFRGGGPPDPELGAPAPVGPPVPTGEPIKVGVLHSQTGTMAVSESPVIDSTLLAIDEVNQAGGVLGRPVRAVVADGKSDPTVFAAEVERLIAAEKVAVVFGCWTSASRKAVRPVVERLNGLLFYPVQFEGLEQSPRVVYLGPAPNQQLLPAVDFLVTDRGKRRLFLVGSDYVYPRAAHAIIRDRVKELPGAAVVGEAVVPVGARDVAGLVAAVRAANPDAVVNTLNGNTNFYFFRELRAAGVAADAVPILSVSIGENELRGLDLNAAAGDYLAASYFQSVDREESRAFLRALRARYGSDRTATDAMAAAYTGVHLWAKAAGAAGAADPGAVAAAVCGAEYAGPRGLVRIDPETRYAWLPWRIGRVRADGQVDVIAASGASIRPVPFPPTRPRADWDRFLNDLYIGWDGRWQAPVAP
jgi:urea transport system substrate-binding protein